MADDRYNQDGYPMDDPNEQDDYAEDDKTQLVDLDALQKGGGGNEDEPQFAPPPTMDAMPAIDAEDKTELFEIPSSLDGSDSGGGAITSSAPDYSSDSFNTNQQNQHQPPPQQQQQHQPPPSQGQGQYSPQNQGSQQQQGPGGQYQGQYSPQNQGPQQPQGPGGQYQGQYSPQNQGPQQQGPQQGQHQPPPSQNYGSPNSPSSSGSMDGNFSSVDSSAGASFDSAPPPPSGGRSRDQVVIPGGDNASHDGATAFVNIADFAEEKAHFTPEQQEAGYDGSTQFVDVNALMAGTEDDGSEEAGDPIDNDEELHRGYQFGPEDIQRSDDITLIYAQNALGKTVILKRIWEGRPEEMSTPLRERIAQLHDLKHPNLLAMNGMFVSGSGMWVELENTRGDRLTKILQNGGPLDADTAIELLSPVADVLDLIHRQQLAYANLTTDAIWIDDQGRVLLEPFDMLKLEDRGNLGAFGAPEMDRPPDQRQLSPASDVYSLAAVLAAAITGLPLRPQNLANFNNQSLVDTLQQALVQNPTDRPPSAPALIEDLQGGDGLDIKIVGAGVFAVALLAVAAFAVLADDDDPPPPEPAAEQAQAEDADDADGDSPAPDDADSQAAELPDVELPGTISSDSRLTVTSSFQTNPPSDAIAVATDDQLEEWRAEVDELLAKADDASSNSDKLRHYSEALELLGRLIRKQEDPVEEQEMWREIYSSDIIQEEVEELVEGIREPLLDGRLGSANRRYNRLASIDPDATAQSFLGAHNNATIVKLTREGADDE